MPGGGTFTVNALSDSDPTGGVVGSGTSGDLRYVLSQADNAGGKDTISFAAGLTGTIMVQGQPLPAIGTNLVITGPGANVLSVNGNSLGSVLPVTVSISGLTITGGSAAIGVGGGGINNFGTLTLSNCTLSGNSAPGFAGGGIQNQSTLTLNNCTLSANSAGWGGATYNAQGTVTISNSTLFGNSATR